MSNGQIMLPYTIKAGISTNDYPVVVAGQKNWDLVMPPTTPTGGTSWTTPRRNWFTTSSYPDQVIAVFRPESILT